MEKREREKGGTFRFKHFEVNHMRSSMKVGIDGVLVGLWAGGAMPVPRRVLDVGCGCGVIALICAQRWEGVTVDAIDIDPGSVEEATENFERSPWSGRLHAEQSDYDSFATASHNEGYDLIVSNPPFFDSGVRDKDSPRLAARHQGRLSPRRLVELAPKLLNERGRLALIMPSGFETGLLDQARTAGLSPCRRTLVRGHATAPWKRVLMEFSAGEPGLPILMDELTLETRPGEPTEEYLELGRDFYLKF